MPRPKKTAPDYRYHISGQAVVTFNAVNFYLGPHDSPESKAKYRKLLADYIASGGETPSDETHQAETKLTVADITREYRPYADKKYRNNKSDRERHTWLCRALDDQFGEVAAVDFGPRRLSQFRETLVARGNCRTYVNKQTSIIVRMFRWAVSQELVKSETWVQLRALEPLRHGETEAPEPESIGEVSVETVRATAKHLSPILRAMIRIQAITGMRPSELCDITPAQIEKQPDGVWIYRPVKHKNAHRGKSRPIPLVGDAKQALAPYLERPADAHCFSPKEVTEWLLEQRAAARKTPADQGNRPGTNRVAEPKRRPSEKYDRRSYYQAIRRAAEKAKVDHWFPYQLRYLALTEIRDALDIEAAEAIGGHSKSVMTRHYAKIRESKAIDAAKRAPQHAI